MKKISFIILLAALFFLTGCPNDDPVKPDPCAGKKPVTAEIKIMQEVRNADTASNWIETDTISIDKLVIFESLENYDFYEWQILGDTTRYYKRRQSFRFYEPWGELTVRLIVRSQPDTLCFPTDDGIDTAFKKILVVKKEDLALNGSYLGYHESNPLDTFTVDIVFEGGNRGMVIYNINRGCFVPKTVEVLQTYMFVDYSNHYISFKGNVGEFGCELPSGRGVLDISSNTIVIDYESGPKDDRKQYKFIGVKK
ncbi:MAG: hypothetical protein M9949_13085 [Candidatus Kapabacteria bacterium]|nr:hypothetical protein [Candidatus Kapabacteria bacterium]